MYCPQCGKQNDESAAFCGSCGAKLNNGNYHNKLSSNNTVNNANVNSESKVKYSSDPVLNEVKKFAVSPLMLISLLAFLLMIIMGISHAEAIGISITGYLRNAIEATGMYDLEDTLSIISGSSRLLAVFAMLPQILIAVGICMTVYSAFDKNNDTMSVAGLKTIRVINVISLILNIILTVVYFCAGIYILSKINEIIGKVPFLIILLLIIVLAVLIFRIFYVKKTISYIDCVIYSIQEKIPVVPSKFIGVMMFICGVSYAIMALTVSGSQNWFGAIAYICFGLAIFSYSKKMLYLHDNFKSFSENKFVNEQIDANENQTNGQYKTAASVDNTKKIAFAGIIIAVIIAVVIIITQTTPGIDKALVGKWQYGSSEEYTFEFRRDGVFIGNEGTDYEEKGTYTASDGVITVIIDGEANELNYKIIDSDRIKIKRSYISSNWEREYQWETLHRVK